MPQPSSGSEGSTADAPGVGDCWNRIGTSGDGSCPELQTHIHCRNCPVFAAAARTFFDRSAPEGYVAEWTRWLAGAGDPAGLSTAGESAGSDRDVVSVLIFRLGQEWLAFRTTTVAEVTLPRPVHRVPHRNNEALIGLVNLRGQLQLCVSLHGLLGVNAPRPASVPGPPGSPPLPDAFHPEAGGDVHVAGTPPSKSRLIVLRDRDRSETWIFPAEEVLGVHRLPRTQVLSVSSSLANADISFSQAILRWQDREVSFLDEQRVFAALRSIGQ